MTTSLDIKVERLHRIPNSKSIKAFVDLNINDVILLKGIKVVQGKSGVFVAMPQEQGKDNKWYESIRCLKLEVREMINEKVLAAYKSEDHG